MQTDIEELFGWWLDIRGRLGDPKLWGKPAVLDVLKQKRETSDTSVNVIIGAAKQTKQK